MSFPQLKLFVCARSAGRLIIVFSLLTTLGCDDGRPTRVPVSGQVLIDGQPLTYGSVRFIPPNGRSSVGSLDDKGHFSLTCFEPDDGAILGTHQVEISACKLLSQTKTRWHAPKKYANYNTSTLTQEVTEPTDSMTINLTWDGGKPFVEVHEDDGEIHPGKRDFAPDEVKE